MPYTSKLSSLSVGNKMIDSEHRALNVVLDELTHMIMINHDVATKVSFQMLRERLRQYFVREASCASAVNFDFAAHQRTHENLLQDIRIIEERLANQKGVRSLQERKHCVEALKALLPRHIKVDSMSFKKALADYPYDFDPG
jgi:hemerythrin-like metal-binding protein